MGENTGILTELVNFSYMASNEITKQYLLHCHNFYEVYYFIDGDVDYLVEGRRYKPTPHSLLLLSPHVFHGVRINESRTYRRFAMHFHPDILSAERRAFLLSAFPTLEKPHGKQVYYENADRCRISDYFNALVECAGKPGTFMEHYLPIAVEALLAQIATIADTTEEAAAQTVPSDSISAIIFYLNSHLTEHITLEQISEQFFISKHYLNKAFRKATGTTVLDYLIRKRITCAQQLLLAGCSAGEAAAKSGFRDYSVFYRAYMRIVGHPPLKDRGMLPPASVSLHQLEDVTFGDF